MTTWPEMSLPPINLYNAPARGKDAIVSDSIEQRLREAHPSSQQYALGSSILLEAADKIQRLEQQLEMARPKIAQLTTALSDAQQIIESDANTPENYGSLCRIGSALRTGECSAQAWLLRKQAEAIEKAVSSTESKTIYTISLASKAHKMALPRMMDEAQSLRQKADELEKAGGDA